MTKYINYYNTKIAYDIAGSGTPLVFVHGFGEDRRMWSGYVNQFADYQLVTIDLPGCGESEMLEASIARMAKIVRAVLRAESIEKCYMIGHSMGGYISLAYASLYEKTLLGYCLFHSQPHADSEEKKAGRDKGIAFVQEHGSRAFFKGLIPKLFGAEFLKNNPKILDNLVNNAAEQSTQSVVSQLAAMRDRPDNQSVLKRAAVPVCFIIGKEDVAVPEENSLHQTYLPKVAAIHILAEVGHMGMFEAPDRTIRFLQDFFVLREMLYN